MFPAGAGLVTRIAAGGRPLRYWRCAAEKMGIEREGAGRTSSSHHRPTNENFARERRDDRLRFAECERPLSLRDSRALHLRANRRRPREEYSMRAQKTASREAAPRAPPAW